METGELRPGFIESMGSTFDMEAGSDAHGQWLSGLLSSRDVAACVLEVIHDAGRPDYRFIACSPAFERATGLTGAVGRRMRDLRPDHEEFWFELYARVANTGEPAVFEHAARALDRRFRGDAFRIGAADDARVVVIFDNCAPASGDAGPLVPPPGSEARLERFGATLAHELRAPLGALTNGLSIVRQSPQTRDEVKWALSMMDRQLARISGLIDDLLEVGRLGSQNLRIERRPVDLLQVVHESIEDCASAIEDRRHQVRVECGRGPYVVRGDARRLEQVVTNLLTNSIKYTEPGGHIRLVLHGEAGDPVLELIDDGTGIAAEDLPQVFDFFRQGRGHSNQPRGGLGIGLSLVRSIVEVHGGRVEAHSNGPGTGSRFVVRLPAASATR